MWDELAEDVPPRVYNVFEISLHTAERLAELGQVDRGHLALLEALEDAEQARAAGVEWARPLLRAYHLALEQFREKWWIGSSWRTATRLQPESARVHPH